MKRIRTKLMAGILAVFLVSYAVFMLNIGANQLVIEKSQSLLKDNYPSVKYSFDMLHLLESVNAEMLSSLETKNEEIRNSTSRILKIQKNVGIAGLALLAIFIITIPLFLINPIDRLTERMIDFYKTNFDKDIDLKKNNELEKLEEIFEKIILKAYPDYISDEQLI